MFLVDKMLVHIFHQIISYQGREQEEFELLKWVFLKKKKKQ